MSSLNSLHQGSDCAAWGRIGRGDPGEARTLKHARFSYFSLYSGKVIEPSKSVSTKVRPAADAEELLNAATKLA